jgi:FKBP-type peptidyl-prolyl cis-trans isomerase 2
MAEPKPSRTVTLVAVLLVVIAGGVGFGLLYYENHKLAASHPLTVQIGDNVTVNYIGVFGSSPQVGRVFDTSYYSVAYDNLSWPKSVEFHPHGPTPANFTPLPVSVGPAVPPAGYTVGNLTFIGVVPGFWQGLLGLAGNQTRYVTVPASLGYGAQNQSCLVSRPLSYTLPATVALTTVEFTSQFPAITPQVGVEFPDPTYGWPDYILSVNSTSVVYENLPTLGAGASVNGLPVAVTNLSSTTITIAYQLTPSNAGLVAGTSTSSVCGATSFIVSQVNAASSTFVANYNSETTGQTLIFIVSVVDIFPPS